jgi:hypothetical protein
MSDNDIAVGRVISVLLADGWHRTVPGSFSVGPLPFGASADPRVPGFCFEEADAGSPYQPTVLAGPLDSIIAVRQVTPAMRSIHDPDRALVSHDGRSGHIARLTSGQEAGIWGGLTEDERRRLDRRAVAVVLDQSRLTDRGKP